MTDEPIFDDLELAPFATETSRCYEGIVLAKAIGIVSRECYIDSLSAFARLMDLPAYKLYRAARGLPCHQFTANVLLGRLAELRKSRGHSVAA